MEKGGRNEREFSFLFCGVSRVQAKWEGMWGRGLGKEMNHKGTGASLPRSSKKKKEKRGRKKAEANK